MVTLDNRYTLVIFDILIEGEVPLRKVVRNRHIHISVALFSDLVNSPLSTFLDHDLIFVLLIVRVTHLLEVMEPEELLNSRLEPSLLLIHLMIESGVLFCVKPGVYFTKNNECPVFLVI